jgi:hypothetical protein
MPLKNFQGQTFVAFTDISGFKQLMQSRDRAAAALKHFYSEGYAILKKQQQGNGIQVEGFFISDCAVLFVRPASAAAINQLRALLSVVQAVNRVMLERDVMLTTSISYGIFSYGARREFIGIEKNFIVGEPYIEAYLDQSAGKPKLEPGECRILGKSLPGGILPADAGDLYLARVRNVGSNWYFYWMRDRSDEIDAFKLQYKDAYNLKYSGMLKALNNV